MFTICFLIRRAVAIQEAALHCSSYTRAGGTETVCKHNLCHSEMSESHRLLLRLQQHAVILLLTSASLAALRNITEFARERIFVWFVVGLIFLLLAKTQEFPE